MRSKKTSYISLGFLILTFLLIGTQTFAADGQWSIGNDFLIFKQQGDSSNVNIGIGTKFPTSKLEVNGKIKMADTQSSDSLNTVVTKGYLAEVVGAISPSQWELINGNIYRNSGKVGIGIGTAEESLHIGGSLKVNESIKVGTASDAIIAGNQTLGGGIEGITIKAGTGKGIKISSEDNAGGGILIGSNSNIGIGTSQLDDTLSVGGTLNFNNIVWDSGENINMRGTGEYSFDFSEDQGASRFNIWSPIGEIFTVGSNGYVGIGSSKPTAKLEVKFGINESPFRLVGDDNKPYIEMGSLLSGSSRHGYINMKNNAGDIDVVLRANGQDSWINDGKLGLGTTTPTQKLDVNGNVKATAFIYSSDETLKKNIVKITNPIEKVAQLKGVTFDWKSNNKNDIGVIAQDVQKVFPEAVQTGSDGKLAVDYARLVPVLIEAINAQQAEINELKAQIQ